MLLFKSLHEMAEGQNKPSNIRHEHQLKIALRQIFQNYNPTSNCNYRD